ncbi:hypothetical protein TOT_040000037 [Theileria orientalis strain Shintoku]|uniref:Uncharacterized protein n=1 Tax=Theileria orientalis strain Shintoku TaxID=869250 RepID=J4C467_THEOR|nr:hypothetical protein TOT_040000037 [Theileria orientalis strain Shintoku]PVC52004.1 hypothetical protein MACL_00001083 [Theileria orientalis]BAM41656.1 hypothetical protein TOT_040000037 [Theileria orientalis strain Shintoku]|eukprot:XP_009691957.1 hypothetical protein TOT_040000037 [Theileria orientalis strain Shintoku]
MKNGGILEKVNSKRECVYRNVGVVIRKYQPRIISYKLNN